MALAGFGSPVVTADLPTSYEYYTSGGIKNGLSADQPYFTLNDRNISLYSGAMHYFRVPRPYWRDRLRKMRAAGLNAVETYVPWNLHEPQSGNFDFGDGGNDMSDFLHLEEFLQIAQEEDLFTIVRSGPYICSEFEFGGLPSWLLREDEINIRTSDPIYMKYVNRFFDVLIPILAALQFTKGGSIIMIQVENEYSISNRHDLEYLRLLRDQMLKLGIVELLSTADNPDRGTYGTLPDLFFMTGNFGTEPTKQLDMLKELQPNRPLMTMEFWSGTTDFWGAPYHSQFDVYAYKSLYEEILKYPASVNIYMFHGGTSFGFMNGAQNLKFDELNSDYHSFISSYDFLAPLNEAGQYTTKYNTTKELIAQYNSVKTKLPAPPSEAAPVWYPEITMTHELFLWDLLKTITPQYSPNVIPMEKLDINNNSGQSYGYVVYRKTVNIPAKTYLELEGRVCDTFMVLVNGILVSPWLERAYDLNTTGTSHVVNSTVLLSDTDLTEATLEIVVENWGRANVGVYKQYKGLWQGNVKLNGETLYDWGIYPLEFKKLWTNSLTDWRTRSVDSKGPTLNKATMTISGTPQDTYVSLESWIKGIVIVNGFVLGRYSRIGPIQTLYLPAPLLKTGDNDILIFEHFQAPMKLYFGEDHIYNSH